MRPELPGGPYLVVGLARSGTAAMLMLAEHGDVIGHDSDRPRDLDALAGFEMHVGTDGTELLDRVRTVVKSPGVPREAPVIADALARGIEVTGELELAWDRGALVVALDESLLGLRARPAGLSAALAS